jgi:hypothetical protein
MRDQMSLPTGSVPKMCPEVNGSRFALRNVAAGGLADRADQRPDEERREQHCKHRRGDDDVE